MKPPSRPVFSERRPDLRTSYPQVVDSCPSCLENRLNLAKDAFTQIADETDGIVDVEFDVVSCGITSPLIVRNKVGTSEWL